MARLHLRRRDFPGRPPVRGLPVENRNRVVVDVVDLLVDSERTTRHVWQASTADCGFTLSDEMYLTLIGLGSEEADQVLAVHFGERFVVSSFRERRVGGGRAP